VTSQNGNNPDLYCVEEIQKLLEVIFFTAWLKDENPVSVLLIGPSGTGKSKLICATESPCFLRTDSITSNGLFDIAQRDTSNVIKFLLIPDLNGTLSRRPTTVESTLANLLSFTSDGTVRVDDGREGKVCKHRPIGLITAATTEIYKKNENNRTKRFSTIPYLLYTVGVVRYYESSPREIYTNAKSDFDVCLFDRAVHRRQRSSCRAGM